MKKESKLRALIILALFLTGIALVFTGWLMTGKLVGLFLMLIGVALLLTTLFAYNAPYFATKD